MPGEVEFEQSVRPVLIANAVIGVWLIVNGILAHMVSRGEATVPRGLAWLSIVSGIGLTFIIVGFWIGGEEQPLTTVGGLVSFIGILVWRSGSENYCLQAA